MTKSVQRPGLRARCLALALLLVSLPTVQLRAADGELPPVRAAEWTNWIGEEPTLASLKGRAVLLHFFVCEKPEKANWLGMIRFHRDFADRGLVILAVTPDSAGAVKQLLHTYPLPFAIGAGSDMASQWNMGKYGQVLIDHQGEEFYRVGASNGVWNGKLRKSVNGSRPVGGAAHRQLTITNDVPRGAKRAVEALSEGQLAKALGYLEAILAKGGSDGELIDAAQQLLDQTTTHLKQLQEQIERSLASGEAVRAQAAVDALVKDLKRHPLGKPFVDLASSLKDDEAHQLELEAAEVYDRLVESFFRMGYEKNEKRFKTLVSDFPTTRAAEKMQDYWLGMRWK